MILNEGIRAREVRLVDLKMVSSLESNLAMKLWKLASRVNLDLVLVAPNAKPPVARIMDYGKFRFEQQKKEKEASKESENNQLKRSSFKPND